jgi:hypothetical protein
MAYWVKNAFRPEIFPLTVSTAAGLGLVVYQGNHLFTGHNDICINKNNPRQFQHTEGRAGSHYVPKEARAETYNKMLKKEKWF